MSVRDSSPSALLSVGFVMPQWRRGWLSSQREVHSSTQRRDIFIGLGDFKAKRFACPPRF